jgi:hypothetical protein
LDSGLIGHELAEPDKWVKCIPLRRAQKPIRIVRSTDMDELWLDLTISVLFSKNVFEKWFKRSAG